VVVMFWVAVLMLTLYIQNMLLGIVLDAYTNAKQDIGRVDRWFIRVRGWALNCGHDVAVLPKKPVVLTATGNQQLWRLKSSWCECVLNATLAHAARQTCTQL
jgi:hypothetical protein